MCIRDRIISAPTILDATETVTAVNNISTRLIPPTGTPASFAASSSNVTKNNSLYNNIEVIITAMPSPIVKYNSKSVIATIEPNKKLFILVEPLVINPDNTAVRPIPADITTTVAISEYLPNDFLKTSIPITAKIEMCIRDSNKGMIEKFDKLISNKNLPYTISDLLPKVLVAGENAGTLSEEGAKLLDTTGKLSAGIPLCPPEGDAGTGMTATNSITKRTGNVSAGTSVSVSYTHLDVYKRQDPDRLPLRQL